MNQSINRITNSKNLFTVAIILSMILCVILSRIVESTPTNSNSINKALNEDQPNFNEHRFNNPNLPNDNLENSTVKDLEMTISLSNKKIINKGTTSITSEQLLDKLINGKYDYGFFFRLFVFMSAFCLVIFASMFVKSLNNQKRGLIYGYFDTKCGDEEKLIGKNHDWDDEDEVIMFDAMDFKKEHNKD